MSTNSIASSEPKYLGCRVGKEEYYFFASKDGKGRFLKYVAYPLWCRASDVADILDVSKQIPDEITEEVKAFILGMLHIEVIPKKRGRSEKVVKTNLGVKNNENSTGIHSIGPNGSNPVNVSGQAGGRRSRTADGATGAIPVSISVGGSGVSRSRGSGKGNPPLVSTNASKPDGAKPKALPPVKPSLPDVEKAKRKRRTKAEMAAARALEAEAKK